MNEIKKDFDAVAFMRAQRDAISAQIEGMTLEQELNWLASQEIKNPHLRRLMDIALTKYNQQPSAPSGR